MRNIRIVIWLCLGALCIYSGCTTYHSVGFTGGYNSQELGNNRYRVWFLYNGPRAVTGLGTTRKYLEHRCAEVTVENKKRYFVIESESRSLIPLKLEYVIMTYDEIPNRIEQIFHAQDILRDSGK